MFFCSCRSSWTLATKDGAFVQMGAYWYEVQDLTKSIEAIKEAIEEAENEEAG